jgi:hypothetical protein
MRDIRKWPRGFSVRAGRAERYRISVSMLLLLLLLRWR